MWRGRADERFGGEGWDGGMVERVLEGYHEGSFTVASKNVLGITCCLLSFQGAYMYSPEHMDTLNCQNWWCYTVNHTMNLLSAMLPKRMATPTGQTSRQRARYSLAANARNSTPVRNHRSSCLFQ